jgi:hypothetical protein
MGVKIRIGGLTINLGWLFGRKKKKEKREEVENFEELEGSGPLTGEALKDAVLNCCEQSGAFDEFGIEDPEVIDTLCAAVANVLEGRELTHSNLSNALGKGFATQGLEVKGNLASTFASAFISSYR